MIIALAMVFLFNTFKAQNVEYEDIPFSEFVTAGLSWLPMLLLIGVWIFFMRQMQAGGGKAMSFGKSRAKLLTETSTKATFSDVAGIEEAKEARQGDLAFL